MVCGAFSCLTKLLQRIFRRHSDAEIVCSNEGWSLEHFQALMHAEKHVKEYFQKAIESAFPNLTDLPKVNIAPGKNSDLQVSNALSLAKTLGRSPVEVAQAIIENVPENEIIQASTTDNLGFIQVNFDTQFVSSYAHSLNKYGVSYPKIAPKRVLIDFSSPNIAKEMHVGHLRSTIIGDALCRMYEFCGHEVHRVNHVGDWGTQFGMLIAYLKRQYPDYLNTPPEISDLSHFYKQSKVAFDSDAEFKKEAYAEVVALQSDDSDALKAWGLLCDVSRKEFQVLYDRLDIRLDEFGESFYKDKIPEVLEICENAGMVKTFTDGAKVIMPTVKKHYSKLTEKEFILLFLFAFRNFKEETALHEILKSQNIINSDDEISFGKKGSKKIQDINWQVDSDKVASAVAKILKVDGWYSLLRPLLEADGHIDADEIIRVPQFHYPLIVQKRDGGYTYDTTDMAAIWYRTQVLNADVVRVITDVGQEGHFALINSAARQIGWLANVDVEHVGFGLVTGLDGKRFRTRNTDVVKLTDLIDEAVARCYEISTEKEKQKDSKASGDVQRLSEECIQRNAEVLGVAAIKYHDLKQNRASNYAFSFDKMCDLEGNSALYLLYSYVRICGIMRKVGDSMSALTADADAINKLCTEFPAARALALQLARFHAFLDRAMSDNMPSRITDYVYAIVCRFTDFYTRVTIKSNPAALALCHACGQMVEQCLELLGIGCVDRL